MLTFAVLSLVVSQAQPIPLQALVATSGANVEAVLDGKADTSWQHDGDARNEGVLFRFEEPVEVTKVEVTACPKTSVLPYFNALESYPQDATKPMNWSRSGKLRSAFFKLTGNEPGCLKEVKFFGAKGVLLEVKAPRTIKAKASASSTLEPKDAYHLGYLFDGRLDFGWVEGAKSTGAGEWVQLELSSPVTVSALELWNGYQRSGSHFSKNARAKRVAVQLDDDKPFELAVKDADGAQKLSVPAAKKVSKVKLTILEAYPGSQYSDLVLSELRLWDAEGPVAVRTADVSERAAALKSEVEGKNVAPWLDATLQSRCQEANQVKLRTNHSFVAYSEREAAQKSVTEVFDGAWILKSQDSATATLEFFGRRHTTEESFDPYASDKGPKETTIVSGGPVKLTFAKAAGREVVKAVVAKWLKGPAARELKCLGTGDAVVDALVNGDLVLAEGTSLTAVLRR